jgi:hyperosmotically inducible protein
MKLIRSFLIVAIAMTGLLSGTASAQNFVNKPDGRSIDEQVYKKIKNLTNYDVFDNIQWQVEGDTVVLTGKVYSIGTKSEAADEVKRISGVAHVVNRIDMLPASGMDDQIRRTALREFTQRGPSQYFGFRNPDVHIIVENGRMTLEGYVAHQSDKDMLNVLANGITGVFEVTNNLVVGKRAY